MDPMAIRSYLASLGQGAPGGAGAGGAQGMLANLRNQLYGPQALQQLGGQGGQLGGPGAAGQAPLGGGSQFTPQAIEQLQAQVGGALGAPAANAQGANPNAGPIGSAPGAQTMEAQLNQPPGAAGMPFGVPPRLQGLAARDPAAAQARFAAFQAGQLPGQQGGAAEQGGAPMGAQPLPATMTAPVGGAGGAAPTMTAPVPGGAGAPGAAVANVRQAVQQAKPMRPPQGGGQAVRDTGIRAINPGEPGYGTAPSSPPRGVASPAVLGTQNFNGPNARRIVQARGGIYNNVRNALRKPGVGGR